MAGSLEELFLLRGLPEWMEQGLVSQRVYLGEMEAGQRYEAHWSRMMRRGCRSESFAVLNAVPEVLFGLPECFVDVGERRRVRQPLQAAT